MSSNDASIQRPPAPRPWAAGVSIAAVALGVSLWAWQLQSSGDPARVWRALLINFLFFTPLSAGLVVWTAVLRLARGRWAEPIERPAVAAITFAVPSLLALAALWAGSDQWAPWSGWATLPQGAWLRPAFLFGRDLAALALFWIAAGWYVAQRQRGVRAGVAVFSYAIVFSLIGFDLVMALDPRWHSSLLGGYFFISGLYAGVAAWARLALREPQGTADRRHDLARLTVAFSILTTYMMFAQLLPIWYENLPGETRYIVPRVHAPWGAVSILLLCVVYLGPLVALLTIRARRSPPFLGVVVTVVLIGLWIERWWLVAPVFDSRPRLGLLEAAMALAFAGSFGLGQYVLRQGAGQSRDAAEPRREHA